MGLALDLREDGVGAAIMGPYEHLQEGDTVRTTGRVAEVPVGDALVGRIVDAVGQRIDGKGPIETSETLPGRADGPRRHLPPAVDTPLQTGIKAIDAMIPIGRGQRELIIGDRQTGKTAVALDTIINQKGAGRHLHLRRHRPEAVDGRRRWSARWSRTARWSTRSSSPPPPPNRPPLQFLAPYAGAPWASTSWTGQATR